MRIFFIWVAIFFSSQCLAQYHKAYDAKYLQTPAIYPSGTDSCQRFYFSHFKGFDSVLSKLIANGDTAKYIRVYFSFVIDKYGAAYNAHFEKIASTQYAKGITSKLVKYFPAKAYYEKLVKEMIRQMPLWKPALLNGLPVDCKMEEYLQFWVGINLPTN